MRTVVKRIGMVIIRQEILYIHYIQKLLTEVYNFNPPSPHHIIYIVSILLKSPPIRMRSV